MTTVQNRLEAIVYMVENSGEDHQTIADKAGVHRAQIHRWLTEDVGVPHSQSLQKIADALDYNIHHTTHSIEITKMEQMTSNRDQLVQSQQRTIELQDEKIISQQEAIQTLETGIQANPIERTIWDDINADFEFEVAVKIRMTKLDIRKKYTVMGDLKALSEYTGYSTDELGVFYEIGKWHDSSVAHAGEDGNILYSEGSTERLKNMSQIIIKSVGLFKAMVGEHYIPIPMTFITKDGQRKRSMSYSRLNIIKMQGSAKFVFINGDHN